jgi:hypothetical protein
MGQNCRRCEVIREPMPEVDPLEELIAAIYAPICPPRPSISSRERGAWQLKRSPWKAGAACPYHEYFLRTSTASKASYALGSPRWNMTTVTLKSSNANA